MKQVMAGVLCFWIGCTGAAGQIKITMSPSSTLPDTAWRFKPGDNPAWADSSFDVRSWEKARPSDKIDPTSVAWPDNRGWFRATFRPKQAQIGQDLSLTINQFGSSEIYLDGKRLAVLKPIAFDSGGSQRLLRFVPITFVDTNRHVLAIRYQFRREPMYMTTTITPIEVKLQPANEVGVDTINSARLNGSSTALFATVFGILTLLHLLFYQANRAGRVNRTLAWTMLAFFVFFLTRVLNKYADSLTSLSIVELITLLSLSASFTLLLTAVYQYLRIQRGWFYYSIVGLLGADLLYQLVGGRIPNFLAWIPYVLALADYIRVSWLGRRSRDADARLPWNSLRFAGYSFVIMLLYLIVAAILLLEVSDEFRGFLFAPLLLFVVAILFSIPIGLSLSLVQDYARTHRALGKNLSEVEQLSARMLAQEQEKQQLLARQNELLEEQVHERTAELNQSLAELRATQAQLVQREKLASLGELTAGIAHEIQNPLNFVTNFAEVSVELVDELKTEQQQPVSQRDELLIDELISDLGQNVHKISEHGQRAASIVRGMLQHSRSSTGQKQSTNLNSLVDEAMRLAYHGLRASDKTFNAQLSTDFAADVPLVNAVPEDLSRVLVNLFNNAFYAVKQRGLTVQNEPFAPTVSVRTFQERDHVIIQIQDNGAGIPEEVRSKIFQPFFTTKPTGQGTGLGLSISYDIITKGHGGQLSVETEPGRTVFTIQLPTS